MLTTRLSGNGSSGVAESQSRTWVAPRLAAVFGTLVFHPSHGRVTLVVIRAVGIEGKDLPVLILGECVTEVSTSSRPGVIDEENPIVRRILRGDIVSAPHAFLRAIRKGQAAEHQAHR